VVMENVVPEKVFPGVITGLDAGTSAVVTVDFSNQFTFTGSQMFKIEVDTTDSDFAFNGSTDARSLAVTVTGYTQYKDGQVITGTANVIDDKRLFYPPTGSAPTVSDIFAGTTGGDHVMLAVEALDDGIVTKIEIYAGDHSGYDLPLVKTCWGIAGHKFICTYNFQSNDANSRGYFYAKIFDDGRNSVTSAIKSYDRSTL